MRHTKPMQGCFPVVRNAAGLPVEAGFVLLVEPAGEEVPALVVPLTPECVGALYDKLVTAFSGIPQRFDMAAAALEVIGIERKAEVRRAS